MNKNIFQRINNVFSKKIEKIYFKIKLFKEKKYIYFKNYKNLFYSLLVMFYI
jgi:hypothetical protein